MALKKYNFHISSFWAPAFFPIFAVHVLYMYPLKVFFFNIFHPVSQVAWIALYFADVFIVIFFAIFLFYILRHYLPKRCAVLTGGRK